MQWTNGAIFAVLYQVDELVVPGTHTIDSLQEMVRITQYFRDNHYHDWERFVHVGEHNEGDMILFDLETVAEGEFGIYDSGSFLTRA